MTKNYKTTRSNMSPRVNYGGNTMDTSHPTASKSGNNPGTYSENRNATVGGATSGGFFPSGYVYSSQNSANPTGYFYGNMPQSEQSAALSNSVGAFDNGGINISGGSSNQPFGYRAMQQTGQRSGMYARNKFNGTQPASHQSIQMAGGGRGFVPAAGMQNRAGGTQSMQNQSAGMQNRAGGTQSVQNQSAGMQNRAGGTQSMQNQSAGMQNRAGGTQSMQNQSAGVQNRSTGMQGTQNRAAAPQSGGLFGGIGGMVKGILGKDPLGSIGKVVNIMKMLG